MADEPLIETSPEAPPAAPPVETPAPVPPAMPTYHVAIWDMPEPRYVCLLCPPDAPRYDLEGIKVHVPTVHDVDAVATETVPMLLGLRAEADARMAVEAAQQAAAEEAARQEGTQEGTQEDSQQSTEEVSQEST